MLDGSAQDWRSGGFGVYVHWPFCAAKCPYCDFNSHVRSAVDQERWKAALVTAIRETAAMVPGRQVDSVFFGGGTPSLMPADTVAAVLDAVAMAWSMAPDAEITLEANPTSADAQRFRGYRDAGVNRLSMGVQALNDADLRALGRLHSAEEARRAFDVARATFPRISFDLIYARQGQTLADWQRELQAALAMAADHLSLYQLTIEPGTRFGDLAARGRLRGLPDADLAADLYLATQAICAAAGMPAYEVSNHARPGAEGRHNLIYWRYGDYAGVGPGAHGRLSVDATKWATHDAPRPEDWLACVERQGHGRVERASVSGRDQAVEMLLMGLRLEEGVAMQRFETLSGSALSTEALAELGELGLVEIRDGALRATRAGRPLLDSILKRLLIQ